MNRQWSLGYDKIDGLVQERRNSIANALELRLSCTNPLRGLVVYIVLFIQCRMYRVS